MEGFNVYKDIQDRTNGEIYIGVVGPVRTGKSTFIKKFMDTVVIPRIPDGMQRERAIDELPQSSAGRTIMTTEPKFIPEQAVDVQIDDDASFRVRMIDCVGYIVPSAIGYIEEDQPRMVRTPWYEEPIPFNMAAEIGTKKVITEHSTIGLVITTDGSISDIPRGIRRGRGTCHRRAEPDRPALCHSAQLRKPGNPGGPRDGRPAQREVQRSRAAGKLH